MSELTTVLSEAFDVATDEGTPAFEPIPAGAYVAVINDIKAGPLKSGKGEAVLVTWEIGGDKYSGRRVWDRIIIKHESTKAMELGRRKFKDLAEAILRRAGGLMAYDENAPLLVQRGYYPLPTAPVDFKPAKAPVQWIPSLGTSSLCWRAGIRARRRS